MWRAQSILDSSVVRIGTDDGLMGRGAFCPFGHRYAEACRAMRRQLRSVMASGIRRNSTGRTLSKAVWCWRLATFDAPGFGVEPDRALLSEPVAVFS